VPAPSLLDDLLDKKWVYIAFFVIIGGLLTAEFLSTVLWPIIDYKPTGLPRLEVGATYTYRYMKDDQQVGSYEYTVEKMEVVAGTVTYGVRSRTNISFQGKGFYLESLLVVSEAPSPLSYSLNGTVAGDETQITCTFQGSKVKESARLKGETSYTEVDIQPNTLLADNNMPGHWELFFRSFSYEQGKRYKASVFSPQGGSVSPMELNFDSNLQTVTIDGKSYSCIQVRETNNDLYFYLYQGALIKYVNNPQGVVLIRIP
jgi:hypothetical protein